MNTGYGTNNTRTASTMGIGDYIWRATPWQGTSSVAYGRPGMDFDFQPTRRRTRRNNDMDLEVNTDDEAKIDEFLGEFAVKK